MQNHGFIKSWKLTIMLSKIGKGYARTIFALAVLVPGCAAAGPLDNCNSPKAQRFIVSGMNQILAQRGASFLKFAVPSEGPGYTAGGNPVCMIGFYDSDGMPMSGQFSYHTNLAGQIVVTFLPNPQP